MTQAHKRKEELKIIMVSVVAIKRKCVYACAIVATFNRFIIAVIMVHTKNGLSASSYRGMIKINVALIQLNSRNPSL